MAQIVQVQSGQTTVRLPDLITHESLEKVLLTDEQFDKLSTAAFTSTLTDLGPGLLTAVVNLSSVTENGQTVVSWTPSFRGAIRSVMALVTTAVTTASKAASFSLYIDQVVGASEVNVVTISGSPTGGTFTLTVNGQTTSGLAFNAAAATVQTAIEALSNVKVGDVTVTGSAGGPYTLTWGGNLAGTDVATSATSSLTGGTSPTVTVTTSTGGSTEAVYAFTAISGGVLALTSANATPIGKALAGTNVKASAANPNTFTPLSSIQLRASGVTAFTEGTVVFLVVVEPTN